ncbi:tRNA (adenosine(37)-N6)-threonylcarbamoyltransferase complex ATPase subunit type 1 TsaE [Deinococcus metallilatus]|uniref:tRNA threonylcarbamoyladenosine biosynthesis protein TsaE n=1 Tax=Deinococcus metallilatus TaxID=1211322 RepID=A0AAJ5F471_9DEIO|nr:tRNA (adenosine(37)-N6)-threonylcarbamoyltransferase complex ATPase subunit type 1 TsaE [Deinococcus metallilatus]MBB5294477.1 tRNA threonylcarbamoyladenosine biosynthesis protein TsaE [Deinococcus metallilatus]QBY07531.1 tRNA (adenosine(37)-N6)-threonylcarbamoyltransferase complex ATPase subunit type 1 TsaE [Deinococcus metallilatus]RXJ13947.1 tRNA (adenosine(37)-N6)-threonylcarbamoyltransferase complex ATPase subunit type 1 TsaE [Deinococcus metallilatus]TLK29912.1 tRNA (adenosine(37)-N6)-
MTAPALPLLPGETRLLHGQGEQRALGTVFAQALPAGAVLFLEGELGAGKTTLTGGLVAALGFGDAVTSPTYALIHAYPAAAGRVLHVDAYRVRDVAELYEMDLEELILGSRLTVIEWGEGLYGDYPGAPILLLEHVAGEPEVRRVTRLR